MKNEKKEITVTPINKEETSKIIKVGNAHYVNLPANTMKRYNLKEGQDIDWILKNVVNVFASHDLFGQKMSRQLAID